MSRKPSETRESFQNWLDQYDSIPTNIDEVVKVGEKEKTGRWLIGQLWQCTDCLPAIYCDQLGIQKGSSYAAAVRFLRTELVA